MKKITAVLIALVMLLTASAFAQEAEWVELDLTDLTVTVPEDVIGYIADSFEPDVPIATFYEDYIQNHVFNKNISIAYTNQCLDIHGATPSELAGYIVEGAAEQLEVMGIKAEEPVIIDADLDEQDGREALFVSYYTYVDYSGLGYNEAFNMVTIQMVVPFDEYGITYMVTISTDNPEESEMLFRIADSIKWNI